MSDAIIKVLFIGPPAVGKTSLRKFFFEGVPAKDLIDNSLPPTKGLTFNSYDHIFSAKNELEMVKEELLNDEVPFKASVLDAAGQELEKWLDSDATKVFPSANLIYFVFDASEWLNDDRKDKIKEIVLDVFKKRAKLAPESFFYIIGNKFDTLPKGTFVRKALRASIKNELGMHILNRIDQYQKFEVFITSLVELTYDSLDAIKNLIEAVNKLGTEE